MIVMAKITGGLCFATMAVLLTSAYFPGFAPTIYFNLRSSGLLSYVPALATTGLFASIAWLWLACEDQEE